MSGNCQKRRRKLYTWETEEFGVVFGDTLAYDLVRIHECTPWPDRIDRLGRSLKRMPPPGKNDHNAITLGNHCYFPVQLPDSLLPPGHPEGYKLDWLIHELTHAWQYQVIGWKYIWLAIRSQFRDKELAYDFGGEGGLLKSRQKEKSFKQFNPEQQGNIVQTYYIRKRANLDTGAWQPFIDDIHQSV